MDKTNALFLQAVRASMEGRQLSWADPIPNEEWNKLMLLSQMHHILPMLLEAIHACPAATEMDDALRSACRRDVIVQVSSQSRRTALLLQLLEHLHSRCISVLVVKGIVCRSLYPMPDHRVSGDEDLLCHPDQFVKCHQALIELGFTATGDCDSYEVGYRHPDGLYIELHRTLFSPDSEPFGKCNRFFENAFDAPATVTVDGIPVATLPPTEHLLYLLLHAFKHFLHSGFGIRQICDIVLLAKAYGDRIDWNKLYDCCAQLRAERFAGAIFAIGQKYLGFEPGFAGSPWSQLEVDEVPLLLDILGAGVYGTADADRIRSASITLRAAQTAETKKDRKSPFIQALFPPVAQLKSQYTYLKRHPWLVGIAWLQRIFSYLLQAIRGKASPSQSLAVGSRRMQLLQIYNIID